MTTTTGNSHHDKIAASTHKSRKGMNNTSYFNKYRAMQLANARKNGVATWQEHRERGTTLTFVSMANWQARYGELEKDEAELGCGGEGERDSLREDLP